MSHIPFLMPTYECCKSTEATDSVFSSEDGSIHSFINTAEFTRKHSYWRRWWLGLARNIIGCINEVNLYFDSFY